MAHGVASPEGTVEDMRTLRQSFLRNSEGREHHPGVETPGYFGRRFAIGIGSARRIDFAGEGLAISGLKKIHMACKEHGFAHKLGYDTSRLFVTQFLGNNGGLGNDNCHYRRCW